MITICAIVLFLVVWFGSGFIAAGCTFAYFQRKYSMLRKSNFNSDQLHCIVGVLFGVGALVGTMLSPRYRSKGWLNPWGKKAKQEAGLI